VEAAATVVNRQQLARTLGFWGATGIVIGSMIGSAIFVVPALITKEVGSRHAGIAVWVISGVLSLFGALCFAELSSMMPQAGGQYVYLREAYGSLVGFLCGWVFFLAAQSGGIAAVAAGLSRYLASFFPLSSWQQRIIAGIVIVVLTAINYLGVRAAGWMQVFLTGTTIGIVVSLIAIGYALVRETSGGITSLPVPYGPRFLGSFGVAMAAALWAYEFLDRIAQIEVHPGI